MLDDEQKAALGRWYRRGEVVDQARRLIEGEDWEDLEEYLHMHSLFPLGRSQELPDYLRKDDGTPLLPSLDPSKNLEAWQDAIEVGWEALEAELGVSHDDAHRAIAKQQERSWNDFLASGERRQRERGEQKP